MSHPLQIEKVGKTFIQGDHHVAALAGVDLIVEESKFLAIMGASGSGKSTLLHLMAGLTRPDTGRILVRGKDIAGMSDRVLTRFRREEIGLVFQSFNLIPTLTAAENMALPLRLARHPAAEIKRRVNTLLDRLGIAHRGDHRPDAMSGGEQQRVAIGRALVASPAVVLADEPTGNLDSANGQAVCELLQALCHEDKVTIVMVTHEPGVAIHAQEVAVLRDGELIERFATAECSTGQDLAVRYHAALNPEIPS